MYQNKARERDSKLAKFERERRQKQSHQQQQQKQLQQPQQQQPPRKQQPPQQLWAGDSRDEEDRVHTSETPVRAPQALIYLVICYKSTVVPTFIRISTLIQNAGGHFLDSRFLSLRVWSFNNCCLMVILLYFLFLVRQLLLILS